MDIFTSPLPPTDDPEAEVSLLLMRTSAYASSSPFVCPKSFDPPTIPPTHRRLGSNSAQYATYSAQGVAPQGNREGNIIALWGPISSFLLIGIPFN